MENAVSEELYNPNGLIALRRINHDTNENTYPLFKAVDLEGILNKNNILEQRIEAQEKQIGMVLNNLTAEGWYSENVEKDEVLRDLCEIFGYEPKREMSWTITVTVSGRTEVDMNDVEDFDIRYHLADDLSIDSNGFDTIIESWDIDLVDSQEWE